jgi:tRNA (guanine9-N1)-methyltransferase
MGNFASLGFALPLLPRLGLNARALQGATDAAAPPVPPTPAPSKRAQKRAVRDARRGDAMAARKKARKEEARVASAARTAERAAARDAALAGLTAEEREHVLQGKRERAAAVRKAEREAKERVREAMRGTGGLRVCVDLGWGDCMSEKEMKSLVKQIAYSYSAVRKAVEDGRTPLSLSVTGVDARVSDLMTKHSSGWKDWPIVMTAETLAEVHAREEVVYLTHDAEDVLEVLDPAKVYVVGGIVDRNRLKGATWEKARELGVATARLNLDTSVHIGNGTPVLTVNHCVDILLQAAHGVPWQEAYLNVLPVRKGIKVVSDGSGDQDCGGER